MEFGHLCIEYKYSDQSMLYIWMDIVNIIMICDHQNTHSNKCNLGGLDHLCKWCNSINLNKLNTWISRISIVLKYYHQNTLIDKYNLEDFNDHLDKLRKWNNQDKYYT